MKGWWKARASFLISPTAPRRGFFTGVLADLLRKQIAKKCENSWGIIYYNGNVGGSRIACIISDNMSQNVRRYYRKTNVISKFSEKTTGPMVSVLCAVEGP